jgi:hypothetical protein
MSLTQLNIRDVTLSYLVASALIVEAKALRDGVRLVPPEESSWRDTPRNWYPCGVQGKAEDWRLPQSLSTSKILQRASPRSQ